MNERITRGQMSRRKRWRERHPRCERTGCAVRERGHCEHGGEERQLEKLPIESVHPQTQGYYQMADVIYSVITHAFKDEVLE